MRTPPAARILCSLLLCAPAFAVPAGERWQFLGETAATPTWPAGQLSIDVGSLRQRGSRHEIWERTVYTPTPSQQWTWLPEDGPPERRTLWSIRCGRSAMAIVTRGLAGAYEPRPEKLKYYVPAPRSADAAVLEAACGHIRNLPPPPVATQPEPLPDDRHAAWRILERPPASFIDEEEEDD